MLLQLLLLLLCATHNIGCCMPALLVCLAHGMQYEKASPVCISAYYTPVPCRGAAMATRLLGAGYRLIVCDRNEEAVNRLQASGRCPRCATCAGAACSAAKRRLNSAGEAAAAEPPRPALAPAWQPAGCGRQSGDHARGAGLHPGPVCHHLHAAVLGARAAGAQRRATEQRRKRRLATLPPRQGRMPAARPGPSAPARPGAACRLLPADLPAPGLPALPCPAPAFAPAPAPAQAYLGPEGILAVEPQELHPHLLVDCSTIDPITSREVSRAGRGPQGRRRWVQAAWGCGGLGCCAKQVCLSMAGGGLVVGSGLGPD